MRGGLICGPRGRKWSAAAPLEGGMETLIHFVWYGGRNKGEEGAETEGEMRDV